MTHGPGPVGQPPQPGAVGNTWGEKGGSNRNPVLRFLGAHWIAVVLGIIVIIFVAENRDEVSVDILFVHVRSWLWLILAVTAAIGVVIGLSFARRRAKKSPPA
jgi:uncharacterized integral membrane protein